jgi:hypothetical protein
MTVGLLPWLKSRFYPRYRFDKKWSKGLATGNKRRGARAVGRRLDLAMTRIVHRGFAGRTTAEAKLLADWLKDQGFTPEATQVHVKENGVFTWIDLVCTDRNGKLVLFELKAGFRGYYEYSNGGRLSEPLAHLSDSMHNQHQLQLAYGAKMYQICFPERVVDLTQSAVLVVNESVVAYPLEHDLSKLPPLG